MAQKKEGEFMLELATLSAAARNGDGAAVQQFFGMLCDVLRRLARSRLGRHSISVVNLAR
jgi:hypothetical protein